MGAGRKNIVAGVKNINAGAKNMIAGAKNINAGAKNIVAGVKNINAGVKNINAGVKNINAGVKNKNAGVKKINAVMKNYGRRRAKQVGRKWCTDRATCVPSWAQAVKTWAQAGCSVFYNYQIHLGLPLAQEVNVGAGGVGLANSPRFQMGV